MPNELTKLRRNRNIPASEIVSIVRRFYPSFDKTMLSKCENGEKYGILLKPNVMDTILDELAPESREVIKRRIRGGHRLTHRIHARLEESDYTKLQQYQKRDGYKTMQDLLADLIKKYISKGENHDKRSERNPGH